MLAERGPAFINRAQRETILPAKNNVPANARLHSALTAASSCIVELSILQRLISTRIDILIV